MKKSLATLLLIVFMILSFSGCTKSNTDSQKSEEKIKIAVSVFPVYDFIKNILGDCADVFMIVPPGNDSHSFEPTPNDIIKLINADLFIYIGGTSESWVSDIIDSASLDVNKTLELKNFINLYSEETHDHSHEHTEIYDEHIWTSPKNALIICEKIFEKTKELYEETAKSCENSYLAYTENLKLLDNEFEKIIENAKRKTLIFGDRFPFLYFAKDYGLEYYAAFPGCASESEPSAATIAELTDKIKESNIPVVFHIEFSNEKIADILCENTGAEKRLFHSCHSITKKQLEENISYIDIMKKNAENLREALN